MKKYIIVIFLIFAAQALYSQFFVDMYYGNNYSNKQAVMPFEDKYSVYDRSIVVDSVVFYYTPTDTLYLHRHYTYDTSKIIKKNLYKSDVIGISAGYRFSNNISLGIAFNYLYLYYENPSFYAQDIEEELNFIYSGDLTLIKTDSIEFDNYNIDVNVSYYYPINKLEVFIKAGINLYYSEVIHKFNHFVVRSKAFDYKDVEWEKNYWGYSCGFNAGIGVKYNFYKNISAFAKFGYSLGNLNIRKGELVEYYNVDEDVTKEVPSEIEPHNIPFYKIPYSGYNARIGLRYTFGSTGKNKDDND
jgi:hypothetical protein